MFTPAFANFTASFDYFEIDVRDQISTLGAGAIVGSCYSLPNFPNAFCDLFNRVGTGANPLNIEFIRDSYLNINKQLVRGYDLNLRWDGDFNFGKVEVESQFTYTMENVEQLFDSSLESGFDSNDYVGLISYPKLVGNVRSSLTRGDFTYTWGMRYVDETENFNFTQPAAYFGNPNPVYDTVAEDRLYHSLSVRYAADSWTLLVGVDNVLDKDPPTVSTGTATRYGNIPAFATQYDWFGRSLFARMTYRF